MLREEVEWCPCCNYEVEFPHDVEKDGYNVICPNCGKELMLCDACMHSEDNLRMKCNWSKETGCFRKIKKEDE